MLYLFNLQAQQNLILSPDVWLASIIIAAALDDLRGQVVHSSDPGCSGAFRKFPYNRLQSFQRSEVAQLYVSIVIA